MKRAVLAVLACVAALALPMEAARAQTSAPAAAEPSAQALFDEGRAALKAGEVKRAAALLYDALETLRRQGREESADDAIVSAFLASALDRLDHPQANEAFKRAIVLLARAPDPGLLIDAANGYLSRLHRLGETDEGIAVAEHLVARMKAPDVSDESRIEAMNILVEYFNAIDRKDRADAVLETLGPLLNASTPRAARIRGIARLGLARASRDDGRMNDFARDSDGAIADLRLAMPQTAELLGTALLMRGKTLFEEGYYLEALPRFAEAASILANIPAVEQTYIEARSFQARMLSRIERNQEALELIEALVAEVDKRNGPESRTAAAVRLDRVEMLMNADRRDDAIRQLNEVSERMGGKADHFMAGQYFDRLAAIEIDEENYTAAAKSAERAIEAYRTGFPDAPALQLEPMRKRATASEGLLDADFADRAFRDLVDLSVRVYRPEHPEVARDLNAYAQFLENAGRLDEAELLLRRAVAALERAYGKTGQKYAYALNNLGKLLSPLGRHQEAAELFQKALDIFGDAPAQAESRATVYINLANALNFLGRSNEALGYVQRIRNELPAMAGRRERFANATDMINMMTLAHLGQLEDSWRQGVQAIEKMPIRTKEDARNAVNILLQMGDVARRAGDARNALAATTEASKLMTSQGVETNQLWREWAQIALPSLWRAGQP